MKVLLTTTTGTSGVGGHLYTVRAHAEALGSRVDCVVVGIGAVGSPALETLGCRVHQVGYRRSASRWRELREFLGIVRDERPDVIHAFDRTACAFARLAAWRYGCGLVLTICGGPNPEGSYPRVFLPRVERLVLFSEENERFFRAKRKFKGTQIWRIPNRVQAVGTDAAKVERVRGRLKAGIPTILRVGRFDVFHERTALQCVRLVKRLRAEGNAVQLALLGVVQNEAVRARVAEALAEDGVLVNDPDLVAMGSAVLDAGDLVVGTGRSLMEAAARRRVLLVPVHEAELPALVTEANWQSLFRANFSGRAVPDGWNEEENYRAIRRALTEVDYRGGLAALSARLYAEHFALSSVLDKYLEIYGNAPRPTGRDWWDFVKHWLWLVLRTHHARAKRAATAGAGAGAPAEER